MHNFCDTCTTSVKRAQLLGNVHNISDTRTTSLKCAHIEYLKILGGDGETRYTLIYIHTDILYCIHIVFRFIFDHDFANPTNLLIGGYHFLNSTFGNYNNM